MSILDNLLMTQIKTDKHSLIGQVIQGNIKGNTSPVPVRVLRGIQNGEFAVRDNTDLVIHGTIKNHFFTENGFNSSFTSIVKSDKYRIPTKPQPTPFVAEFREAGYSGYKLVIMRGLPGSGKTTLAEKMEGYKLFEANQFFTKNGVYRFNPELLHDAHTWCREETRKALADGNNVIVANTFVRNWEMELYVIMARGLDATLEVFIAQGEYKNIHDVPDATIAKMKRNWENFVVTV